MKWRAVTPGFYRADLKHVLKLIAILAGYEVTEHFLSKTQNKSLTISGIHLINMWIDSYMQSKDQTPIKVQFLI